MRERPAVVDATPHSFTNIAFYRAREVASWVANGSSPGSVHCRSRISHGREKRLVGQAPREKPLGWRLVISKPLWLLYSGLLCRSK